MPTPASVAPRAGAVAALARIKHETRFTSFVSSREPAPNLWTDAWLAALAMALDYAMTTFDRGFTRFGKTLQPSTLGEPVSAVIARSPLP